MSKFIANSFRHRSSVLRGRLTILRQQKGMVLILAMLVVVLVSSIVVTTTWKFQLGMARNENRWHGSQARSYLEGAEQLALKVIREDNIENPNVDHLTELWAQQADFPTDHGWISGKLVDAQSLMNLNLLGLNKQQVEQLGQNGANGGNGRASSSSAANSSSSSGGARGPQVQKQQLSMPARNYTVYQRRFIRLLQAIELSEGPMGLDQAMMLTDAVIDWVDADSQLSGARGGAEADYYDTLPVPISIPNGEMASVSELSVIRGFRNEEGIVHKELVDKLMPLVSALPVQGVQPGMNINTMPVIMYQTFNKAGDLMPLPLLDIEQWVEDRMQKQTDLNGGYQDVNSFLSIGQQFLPNVISISNRGQPGGQGGGVPQTNPNEEFHDDGLLVKTEFFYFHAETLVGEQKRKSKSLIYRGKGADKRNGPQILRRTDANF